MPIPGAQFFVPPAEHEWYYKIRTPFLNGSSFTSTFIEPFSPPSDRSRGRYTLPFSPAESRIRDDPKYEIWDRRIFLDEAKQEWLFYQVWQNKTTSKDKHADMYYCHGVNDYGGKFSDHAELFLNAGYRLIVPDLVSHGRSTGLHCYLTSMEEVVDAVDMVICDVALCDEKDGVTQSEIDRRKRFIAGASMGGFTALFYTIQYPSAPPAEAAESSGIRSPRHGLKRPRIDGAMILCPMLEISSESRPHMLVEYFARAIAKIAGRWPLAEAHRGKGSDDPAADEEFNLDPQTYSGKLRIATGLSMLQGILNINSRLEEVSIPFKVFHGTGDRITNYRGSEKLFERASSKDKEIQLYPGDQHILLKKGKDEKSDARRQKILRDMLDWLDRHSSHEAEASSSNDS